MPLTQHRHPSGGSSGDEGSGSPERQIFTVFRRFLLNVLVTWSKFTRSIDFGIVFTMNIDLLRYNEASFTPRSIALFYRYKIDLFFEIELVRTSNISSITVENWN